ncbi:MAG TPA: protein kinase [Steroidobacteraceae bacterium]|nr:protein kinase [Steroidobacteraceae bacterium]
MEALESMSDTWTRWQGHLINGVFPLGRFLGCSDHSGVFLTRAGRYPADVAIKLVPANRALTEALLPRWKRAGGLAHPHLLRLLEWGGCQLDGLPYLYAVMEYADQTLAQLLPHRALTDDEAREMLPPILDALAFLHGRKLVQGQLKPANILVVGAELKLASDTIRHVDESLASTEGPGVYDPPEALEGSSSTAGDIWALGASLLEALTRRPRSGFGEHRGPIVLPADFSPPFREVVTRCLSARPQDRPDVTELAAWTQGRSAEPAPAPDAQPAATTARPVARESAPPLSPMAPPPQPRVSISTVLSAVVILGLGWTGVHLFRGHLTRSAALPAPAAPVHGASQGRAAPPRVPTTRPGQLDRAGSPSALHQVIPDVPLSARRTIHGHIKVWVRVIVGQDGSVFAAVADRAGPSRYFQRLAVEAAKQWTFPRTDTTSRRLMQVRFDFSREGTTGRAVPLH